jgi:hypothetical protein
VADDVIAERVANALLSDVEINPFVAWLLNYETHGFFSVLFRFLRNAFGGL